MRLTLDFPFSIVTRSTLDQIADEKTKLIKLIKDERESFTEQVRKASHNAYAGIVCDVCKKNVYRGEGTWVHSNGKAYCLEPCWVKRDKKEAKDA